MGRAEGARAAERDADVAVWVDRCNALRATCERQGAELEAVRRAERRAAAAAEEAEQRVREEQGAGSAVREQLAGAQAELRQQRARCSALEMELRQLQRRQQLQGRGQLAGEADEWSDEEEGWGDGVQRLEAVPGRLAWSSNGSWGGGLAGYGGQWKQQRGAAAVAAAAAAAEVTGAGVGGARSAVRSKASAALRRLEVRPGVSCPCRRFLIVEALSALRNLRRLEDNASVAPVRTMPFKQNMDSLLGDELLGATNAVHSCPPRAEPHLHVERCRGRAAIRAWGPTDQVGCSLPVPQRVTVCSWGLCNIEYVDAAVLLTRASGCLQGDVPVRQQVIGQHARQGRGGLEGAKQEGDAGRGSWIAGKASCGG